MKKAIYSILLLIVVSSLFTGCALRRPYEHEGRKNLTIESDITSNLFDKVSASLNILSLDKNCHAKLEGTIILHDGIQKISLPDNKMMVFEVTYQRGQWITFGNTITRIFLKDEGLITVKPEENYKLTAFYGGRFYNTELFVENKDNKLKELTMVNRKACRQLKR